MCVALDSIPTAALDGKRSQEEISALFVSVLTSSFYCPRGNNKNKCSSVSYCSIQCEGGEFLL